MVEPNPQPRSRAGILALALAVLAAVLAYTWWPAAAPGPAPSNQPRQQRSGAAPAVAAPLQVKLDDLKQPPPAPGGEDRNPFRFYVKPAPPPPAPKPIVSAPPPPSLRPGGVGYVEPPPPPIPLKFIGTMEQGKKRVAIFSDGRGLPVYASEGELVMGQYKLVRIQVESVVMEYPDGRGRQTIPMRGQ